MREKYLPLVAAALFGSAMALAGVWVGDVYRVNWNAATAVGAFLGAIATLGAVGVALTPILHDAERRRRQAPALRLQLLTHLTALRPTFVLTGRRLMEKLAGMSDADHQAVAALEALMPHVHLLEADEYNAFAPAFLNITLARRNPLSEQLCRDILSLLDDAINTMQTRDVLRGPTMERRWPSEESPDDGDAQP